MEELEKQTQDLPLKADALQIVSQVDLDRAGAFLQGAKKLREQICSSWDPVIAKAHQTHTQAVMEKRKFTDRIDLAISMVKAKVGAWAKKQDDLRREEIRRQQEKQRLEAEALRAGQEAEDRARIAKEKAQREAEEKVKAAREAEQRAESEGEREKARLEAARAESEAKDKIAEIDKTAAAEQDQAIADAAKQESALPAAQPAPKPSLPPSTARRVDWKWEIQNPAQVERELCSPDRAKIGNAVDQAKAMGLAPYQIKIPGVRIWEEITIITLKERG